MTSDAQPTDGDRLLNVEMLLSHLQHDVDKLNEALVEQQAQIDELRRLVSKVESMVEQAPEPPRDPGDERPPHY